MPFVDVGVREEPFVLSLGGRRWAPAAGTGSSLLARETVSATHRQLLPHWLGQDWPGTESKRPLMFGASITGSAPPTALIDVLSRSVVFEEYSAVAAALDRRPDAIGLLMESLAVVQTYFGPVTPSLRLIQDRDTASGQSELFLMIPTTMDPSEASRLLDAFDASCGASQSALI
jgi:hypothetical protein